MKRLFKAVELLGAFITHFFWANIEVAMWVFIPNRYMKPAVVCLPLRIQDEQVLSLMAWMISLTPGSLIVDISPQRKCMFIHFLHSKNPAASMEFITSHYEDRLLQIFPPKETL